jgi:hypothetical protein
MSLIVLASDKGSPGVTTTAVALAGVWPRRAILAECDPSGGDLVYRTSTEGGAPLNPNIGMLSLATTARHGLSPNQLEQHLQRLQGGLELVTGLATGDQSAGLTGLWPTLGRAFAALPEADVIADCGRVEASGPALELMAAASLVVLIARTSAEQIAHVRDRALSLLQRVGNGGTSSTAGGGLGVPIGVVLIVDPKLRARATGQVDELLRNSGLPVRVIGTIADDPDGAQLINGRGRGRLDRTMLIRSTREVALDLYTRFVMPSQGPGQGAGAAGAAAQQASVQAPARSQPQSAPPAPPVPPAQGPGPAPQQPQSPQQYSGSGAPNQYGSGPQRPMTPPQQPQAPQPPQQGPSGPVPQPQPQPQYSGQPPMQYGGGQPVPPPQGQAQSGPRTPQQPGPPTPPGPAPANTYTAPMPPPPGTPTYRQDTPAPAQATVWPGEQPPPPSAHEGFTSVTLSSEQGPRPNPPTPPYPDERHDPGPGRGGPRSGPPQENQ